MGGVLCSGGGSDLLGGGTMLRRMSREEVYCLGEVSNTPGREKRFTSLGREYCTQEKGRPSVETVMFRNRTRAWSQLEIPGPPGKTPYGPIFREILSAGRTVLAWLNVW